MIDALAKALSSIARYPDFSQSEKLKACRHMEKVLKNPRVFHDLSRDPHALVKEYKIRLPIDVDRIPGPFLDAKLTLASMNLLLIMAADSLIILDAVIRTYPNTWRWILFFHPKFGNVVRHTMEDVSTVERAITSLCVFPKGRDVIRQTEDGFHLLFDIWINLFHYVPPSSISTEWPQLEECDRTLGNIIRAFFDDIPGKAQDKQSNIGAIVLAEAALAATEGSTRKLHRQALHERLLHFTSRKPIPLEALEIALSSTVAILTSLNIMRGSTLPRDVVYTLVESWEVIAAKHHNALARKVCEHLAAILAEFHERTATDFRQLAWAIRAGIVPPVLEQVRMRRPTEGVNAPFLLQFMRAQMVYRNFMRVLHRYAGPAMIIRKDDPVPVRAFITEYQENVKRLDQTKAWMQSLSCYNPECPSASSDPTLKKCAGCNAAYYCSQECQAQHWKAEHHKTCGPSTSKPSYFSPADFRYTTAITRKYLIKMRATILAQVANIQRESYFNPAQMAVLVLIDFASLNLGGSLEVPQEPGVGATPMMINRRELNGENHGGLLQVVLPEGGGSEESSGIYMRTTPFDFERLKEGEMRPFFLQ